MLSQTWRHITYEHRNCWVWAYLEMMASFYTPFDWSSYCTSPSFLWRFSGFSLFWYLPLFSGKYQNMEKPLKHQRRLGLLLYMYPGFQQLDKQCVWWNIWNVTCIYFRHLGTSTLSTLFCVKVPWWTFPWRWPLRKGIMTTVPAWCVSAHVSFVFKIDSQKTQSLLIALNKMQLLKKIKLYVRCLKWG